MDSRDAFYLLFVQDFGEGPLFKNQIDLVSELVNTHESAYYVQKTNAEDYNKAISRLKAYLSQLFSEEAKRNITPELKASLKILLLKKLHNTSYNVAEILDAILTDLRGKNTTIRTTTTSTKKYDKTDITFFENLLDASYISIFTSREIILELNLLNRKLSLVELLLEDLLISLKENKRIKKYRFNFPLKQTCVLFWLGFEKAIYNYLFNDRNSLAYILPFITPNLSSYSLPNQFDRLEFTFDRIFVQKVAKELLLYLSGNHIISVFHLTAPVFLIPSIVINPNDPSSANGYLFLQSELGEDEIHKLTSQELVLWRLFVWEKLKLDKYGTLIEYTDKLSN